MPRIKPGSLGVKQECYLCAMQSPLTEAFFIEGHLMLASYAAQTTSVDILCKKNYSKRHKKRMTVSEEVGQTL